MVRKHISPRMNFYLYKPKSRQGVLIKHIQELAKTSHRFIDSKRFTLVGGGLATIDQLPTVYISGSRTAINIGQKLAEKEPLGLKIAQLIRSHTTARYHKTTCVY